MDRRSFNCRTMCRCIPPYRQWEGSAPESHLRDSIAEYPDASGHRRGTQAMGMMR